MQVALADRFKGEIGSNMARHKEEQMRRMFNADSIKTKEKTKGEKRGVVGLPNADSVLTYNPVYEYNRGVVGFRGESSLLEGTPPQINKWG